MDKCCKRRGDNMNKKNWILKALIAGIFSSKGDNKGDSRSMIDQILTLIFAIAGLLMIWFIVQAIFF
jgi:hypothetical protein